MSALSIWVNKDKFFYRSDDAGNIIAKIENNKKMSDTYLVFISVNGIFNNNEYERFASLESAMAWSDDKLEKMGF